MFTIVASSITISCATTTITRTDQRRLAQGRPQHGMMLPGPGAPTRRSVRKADITQGTFQLTLRSQAKMAAHIAEQRAELPLFEGCREYRLP